MLRLYALLLYAMLLDTFADATLLHDDAIRHCRPPRDAPLLLIYY